MFRSGIDRDAERVENSARQASRLVGDENAVSGSNGNCERRQLLGSSSVGSNGNPEPKSSWPMTGLLSPKRGQKGVSTDPFFFFFLKDSTKVGTEL